MNTFPLRIGTPDGLLFEGNVVQVSCRTITGDLAILAGHINYVAPLGMGEAMVLVDGEKRRAACIGGMVSVVDGKVTLLPTTFEWSQDIDLDRAKASEQRAKSVLENKGASETEIILAKARLKRALVRKGVASRK